MNQNTVYLVPNNDDTWITKVAEAKPAPTAAALCIEGTYPVNLYYSRTDLNGSSTLERDTCQNREELMHTLNWIGECGYVPLSLWEYHSEKPMENTLANILNKAYDRGEKLRRQALEELEDASGRKPLNVLIEKAQDMAAHFGGHEPPDRTPEL